MPSIILLLFSASLTVHLLWTFCKSLHKFFWIPWRIQREMRLQGIGGEPYRFPYGNTKQIIEMRSQSMKRPILEISHDIFPRVQPHVYQWTKIYGMNFLTWHGPQALLFVTAPDLIKEILNNRDDAYPKMKSEGFSKKLMGQSLITNEGEKWAKIRKLANHSFHAESLKGMVPEIVLTVDAMLEKWKKLEGKDIDVYKEFGLLTTEVISRTAFGSCFKEGKHIFEMVAKLTTITVKNVYNVRFPIISKIMKTKDELEAEKLERNIKSSILEVVKKREAIMAGKSSFGNDYLGQLINVYHDPNNGIMLDQMIDEIRTIYGAGHLTTTSLLAWTIFLLAVNTDWQEKARNEVIDLFGHDNPSSDGIARLRNLNMIINEVLRLYPPAMNVTRGVKREVKLGNLTLSPNMNIFIPIMALHHSQEIWGKDVHLFKPERFVQGVAKATNNRPAAFLPFGMGPRTCVGLNFTTNETKITLSMILQRYKFVLSPNYVHDPAEIFLLTPKNGVQVIFQPIM